MRNSSLGSVAAYAFNDRIGLRLPIGGAILLMTTMLLGMILGPVRRHCSSSISLCCKSAGFS